MEYLELQNLTFEEIKKMKKREFKNLVKQKVMEKTFTKLQNVKKCHSKVRHLEHETIVMQKYLQPNTVKMSIQEAQLIFKLRCQVTNVKTNLKGKYDELKCMTCRLEEENQKHIIQECKILNKETEKIEYEELFNGTVKEKIRIARKFKKNYEILSEEND